VDVPAKRFINRDAKKFGVGCAFNWNAINRNIKRYASGVMMKGEKNVLGLVNVEAEFVGGEPITHMRELGVSQSQ
jgi:hypothetical protein